MTDKHNLDHHDADKSKEKSREMGSESSAGAKNQQNWQDNKTQPKTGIKQDGFTENKDRNVGKGTNNAAPVGGKTYHPQDKR